MAKQENGVYFLRGQWIVKGNIFKEPTIVYLRGQVLLQVEGNEPPPVEDSLYKALVTIN